MCCIVHRSALGGGSRRTKRPRKGRGAHVLRDGMRSAYVEGMRKLLEKIEALMTAVAFAEEGDVESARQIMTEAGVAEPDPHAKPEHPSPGLYTPHVAKASGA